MIPSAEEWPHRVVIPASGKALHGDFSADREPVVTVEPGDSVRLSTLDSGWSAGPYQGGHFPERPRVAEYVETAGHALTGPIAVRGARPGMTLEVRIDALVPAGWGTCVAGGWESPLNARYGIVDHGVIHTWTIDAGAMTARNQHGHEVALRPFLGVIGMPPPEPGKHSTIPPRRFGGNLDCRELVAGSTLFLPIGVAGGLLSVGDGHGVQGDGEVAGTAIECPMDRVDLTIGLRDDFPIEGPVASTPAGWIALGLGASLDDAAFSAMEGMIALLGRLRGWDRPTSIALCSVAVDLRITQMVNQVMGVHAVLAPDAIREVR